MTLLWRCRKATAGNILYCFGVCLERRKPAATPVAVGSERHRLKSVTWPPHGEIVQALRRVLGR